MKDIDAVASEELQRAELWEDEGDRTVRCNVCEHRCRIKDGKRGVCMVRLNRGGVLYAINYGRLISANVDPIEKKPLFHFHPGTTSLSIATVGCNLRCRYCQNYSISQWPREHPHSMVPGDEVEPAAVVELARRRNCTTIAHTYTEPTIFLEYARDVARLATAQGIENIFVTNGYMTSEALELMDGWLHAANVDIKTPDDDVAKKLTGARATPVMENIRRMKEKGIWVEATTLVVPGHNDTDTHLGAVAEFLASVDPNIPWHLSRFHPAYKMADAGSTPPETLTRACELARRAGLRYVYTGNLWGDDNESTRCPQCGQVVIRRFGFSIRDTALNNGKCAHCSAPIAGIGLP